MVIHILKEDKQTTALKIQQKYNLILKTCLSSLTELGMPKKCI